MSASDEDTSTLTDAQEKLLSLLPILPTLASTVASGTILYLVYTSGFKTSYKRILFGLSVADIITSVTFSLQPFLPPSETSQLVWASGNDATCTFLGTLTQLALASVLYNGVLSYYYLLTIRFGVKEKTFATRFEPWMHALAIAYPLFTSLIGAGMGFYHELELGPGCWVTDYPAGCLDDTGECKSPLIAWIFSGIWVVVVLLSIVVNNLVIFLAVKEQLTRGRRHSIQSDRQTKRIQAVATQAFLYVAAFFGTFVWNVTLRIMESRYYDAQDQATFFPLLVVQAVLVPSTGVFNLCIYLRPRYLKTRTDCPAESRLWAVRRALYGEAVIRPSANNNNDTGSGMSGLTQQQNAWQRFVSFLFRKNRSDSHLHNPASLPQEAHPDTWTKAVTSKEADDVVNERRKATSVQTTSDDENVDGETKTISQKKLTCVMMTS